MRRLAKLQPQSGIEHAAVKLGVTDVEAEQHGWKNGRRMGLSG